MTEIGRQAMYLLNGDHQLTELAELTLLKGYRRRPDGSTREVTVEILDSGSGDDFRFTVEVVDEDGLRAKGNPARELGMVFHTLHWNELDL